jgi:hypothetical protein
MNLVIDGNLTYPPSEISCVRDVTLYSAIWGDFTVLVEIEREYRDQLWYHLKSYGAYDFIDAIVSPGREPGFRISDQPKSNLLVDRISCETLPRIIQTLHRFG